MIEQNKIPPQAIELEESVLAALIIDSESYYKIGHILKSTDFYKDSHQKIYLAIQELSLNNQGTDMLTVTEKLKSMKVLDEIGGAYYIVQLIQKVATSAHIEYHALIVKQKSIARDLIAFSANIYQKAYDYDLDVSDLIDEAQNGLFEIITGTITKEAVIVSNLIKEEITAIEKAAKSENKFTGITSGFSKIDRITGGWQRSDLIILAARPSMGKTAESLYFAKNAAFAGFTTVFFSLEMSERQLVNRLISYETGINSMNLNTGRIYENDWIQIDNTLHRYLKTPLYIDDKASLSIVEFQSKAKLYKMKYNVDLIIVDYLQLMAGKHGVNRDQEIGSITRTLKATAKTLDIAVICLSQLSRETEKRQSKRPQLSDLRESGNIEQDADLVVFLHRPDKYGELEASVGGSIISTVGMIDNIIAKHRNGAIDDVILWTDESFNNLREYKESKGISINTDKFIETDNEDKF
jgi:replicative DNA helicase